MASRSADPLKTILDSYNRKKNFIVTTKARIYPTEKMLMKIDLNINLFNFQKAGNCDSENLVFHIFSTHAGACPANPQKKTNRN